LSTSSAEDGHVVHARLGRADEYPREVRSGREAFGLAMAWSTKFNQPIKWGARTFATLHDARDYILKLPNSKQMLPARQAATTALQQAALHGGLCRELARISVMQALLENAALVQ
jgi:hypothetical protein